MEKTKLKGNLILLMTAIIWGTGLVAQKLGVDAMPPLAFNGVRYMLAAIVLSPLLVVNIKKTGYFDKSKNTYSAIQYRKKNAIIGGILSGILMGSSVDMQQIGLMTISASKSGFITALYLVFVPIIGIFLGHWPKLKVYVCCVLAMAGFLLLSGGSGLGTVASGELITLLGGVVYAIQIWVVNGFVNKDNDIIISVLTLGVAGISTMIVSLIVEDTTWMQLVDTMPLILYAVFFPTAMGYTGQIVGQKYTDSTSAAFLLSLESVFGALFSVIILGESLAAKELLGCVLIFAANIILQLRPKVPKRQKE